MKELHAHNRASYDQRPCHHIRGLSHGLAERVHTIAFWCLILFLAGAVAGMALSFKYHFSELSKATRLGCLIHEGVTYELKRR